MRWLPPKPPGLQRLNLTAPRLSDRDPTPHPPPIGGPLFEARRLFDLRFEHGLQKFASWVPEARLDRIEPVVEKPSSRVRPQRGRANAPSWRDLHPRSNAGNRLLDQAGDYAAPSLSNHFRYGLPVSKAPF